MKGSENMRKITRTISDSVKYEIINLATRETIDEKISDHILSGKEKTEILNSHGLTCKTGAVCETILHESVYEMSEEEFITHATKKEN